MSLEQEIKDLEKRISLVKSKRDQALGRLQGYKKELKEKFECDSLESAKSLLSKLKRQEEKIEKSIRSKLKKAKVELDGIGNHDETV